MTVSSGDLHRSFVVIFYPGKVSNPAETILEHLAEFATYDPGLCLRPYLIKNPQGASKRSQDDWRDV